MKFKNVKELKWIPMFQFEAYLIPFIDIWCQIVKINVKFQTVLKLCNITKAGKIKSKKLTLILHKKFIILEILSNYYKEKIEKLSMNYHWQCQEHLWIQTRALKSNGKKSCWHEFSGAKCSNTFRFKGIQIFKVLFMWLFKFTSINKIKDFLINIL